MAELKSLRRRLDRLDGDNLPPLVMLCVLDGGTVESAYDQWREDYPDQAAKLDRWKADPAKRDRLPPPLVFQHATRPAGPWEKLVL